MTTLDELDDEQREAVELLSRRGAERFVRPGQWLVEIVENDVIFRATADGWKPHVVASVVVPATPLEYTIVVGSS